MVEANLSTNTALASDRRTMEHQPCTIVDVKKVHYTDIAIVNESPLPIMGLARQLCQQKERTNDDCAFYIFDVSVVIEQYEKWTNLLPRVRPYYAVKCNGDPILVRVLASLGCGFDCASKGEIDDVLQVVKNPHDDIIYANPCKTRNYIRHSVQNKVDLMTFDGSDELRKIKQTAPTSRLILRINVSDKTAQCPLSMKFGCDPGEEACRLLDLAHEEGVQVVGISFHVGSGCRDGGIAYRSAIAHARVLFDYGMRIGHDMHVLDIGGGFPGHEDRNTPFEHLANAINKAIDECFSTVERVRVIAEPGRFFASAAFTLTTNIMARTKRTAKDITKNENDLHEAGYMYYLNDGVYGSFNGLMYDHCVVTPLLLFAKPAGPLFWSSLWGPTCDGLDQIVNKCQLPLLDDGDWVTFEHMGAYSLSAGSTFNGFPRPQMYYFARHEHTVRLLLIEGTDESESSGIESTVESDTNE